MSGSLPGSTTTNDDQSPPNAKGSQIGEKR